MKKLVFFLFAAVLAVSALSGASYAYFTDSITSEQNVIVAGNIDIRQDELERTVDANGDVILQPFTQNQVMMPMVGSLQRASFTVEGHSVQLVTDAAQNYMDKIVSVRNVGSNPAYVRTVIAVPTAAGVNWLHIDTASSPWIWEQPVTAEINGIIYTLYCANYPKALAPDAVAEPSLLGVWVDSMVDFDGTSYYLGNSTLGNLPDFHILVCTQAVQTTTFDNAATGLLTTFGAISADNHPWAD